MIEINLLPRAGKKAGRKIGGAGLATLAASVGARVRDPFLVGAVAALLLSVAAVGGLHLRHTAQVEAIAERERQAQADSARFAAVLAEKRSAEAQRDSILRQLEIIRSIDNDRFVWPHLLEEVSRALPAYTWLTSVAQTSAVVSAAARPDSAQRAADSLAAVSAGTPLPPATDSTGAPLRPPLRFRVVGHTVDIQALTRFMKLLEASPFIQNVQLARTDVVGQAGKQVTEFQLDAEHETPPPSALRMVPVTLSVR
jgi:Tfp pilus assembly protein PilN